MKNEKVVFELSIPEANLIFKALGKLPFEEVYELIGKLNTQANQQLNPEGDYPGIQFQTDANPTN